MEKENKTHARITLAAIGAGGFVGARLMQLAGLSGEFNVLPVLRSYRGLARLGTTTPQARVVDTTHLDALTQVLQGADCVVNLTMGDQLRILQDTQLLYAACLKANVRQLIHLSSAVVFGRVLNPATHDDSPPDVHSWMLYGRGKARAERWLGEQMPKRELQVVVLRPGLIWGPASNWAEMVGDQLLHRNAVLSNGGKGIANLIYLDNLVRIILAVSGKLNGPAGFYNVSDGETVTWQHYYGSLAELLGYPLNAVGLWPDSRLRLRPPHLVEWGLEQPLLYKSAKAILRRVGPGTKALIKSKLRGAPEPPGGLAPTGGPPMLSRANWALQNTAHPLPTAKLQRDFGPIPLIPFADALKATAAWLRFAGFASPASVPVSSQSVTQV